MLLINYCVLFYCYYNYYHGYEVIQKIISFEKNCVHIFRLDGNLRPKGTWEKHKYVRQNWRWKLLVWWKCRAVTWSQAAASDVPVRDQRDRKWPNGESAPDDWVHDASANEQNPTPNHDDRRLEWQCRLWVWTRGRWRRWHPIICTKEEGPICARPEAARNGETSTWESRYP